MLDNQSEKGQIHEQMVTQMFALLISEKSDQKIRYQTTSGQIIGIDTIGADNKHVQSCVENYLQELKIAFNSPDDMSGRKGMLFEPFMRFVLTQVFDSNVTLSPGFLDFVSQEQKAKNLDPIDLIISKPTETEGVEQPLLVINLKMQKTWARPKPINMGMECPQILLTGEDLFSRKGTDDLLRIFQSAVDPIQYATGMGVNKRSGARSHKGRTGSKQ